MSGTFQFPDFSRTIAQAGQYRLGQLQQMALQRDMDEQQATRDALTQFGPGLVAGSAPERSAAYAAIAQRSPSVLLRLLPMIQQERQGQETQALYDRFLGGGAPAASAGAAPAAAGVRGADRASRPLTIPENLRPALEQASQETGLPVGLIASTIQFESDWNPGAVNPTSRAFGLGQALPSTAANPGYGVPPLPRNATPEQQIRWSAQYLAARIRAAGGNVYEGLRGYGEGAAYPAEQLVARAGLQAGDRGQLGRQAAPVAAPGGSDITPTSGGAPAAPAGAAAAPQPTGGGFAITPERLQALALAGRGNPQVMQMVQTLAGLMRTTPNVQLVPTSDGYRPFNPQTGQFGPPTGVFPADRRGVEVADPSSPTGRIFVRPGEEFGRPAPDNRPTTTFNNEQTFGGRLSATAVEEIKVAREAAQTGADAFRVAQRVKEQLAGGAITGTLATQRLAIERALTTAGLIDGRRVSNTEQLMTDLARATLAMASQLKGPTSDRDILFLREAAGGTITLNAETIRRLVDLATDYGGRAVNQYNRLVEPLQNDPSIPQGARGVYAPILVPGTAGDGSQYDAVPQTGQQRQPVAAAPPGSDNTPVMAPPSVAPMPSRVMQFDGQGRLIR